MSPRRRAICLPQCARPQQPKPAVEPIRPERRGAEAFDDIFADIGRDRLQAARKTLGLLQAEPALVQPLMAQARRLVFAKGSDSHDYKFSSAVLEDFFHTAPDVR